MQISFLKDLATPRDPMSPFSFINYLKSQGRLQKFINLGTFLPARKEYEDYMRWCSSHFSKSARYNCEITKVSHNLNPSTGKVDFFTVQWIDHATGQTQEAKTKQVVVATGGRPFVPEQFKPFASGAFPRFMHSSQYITAMNRLDAIRAEPENVRRELEQAMDELTPKSADLEVDSDSLASQLISELSAQVPKKAPGFAKSAEEKEALEKKIVALRSKYTTLRRSLNSLGFSSPKRILVIGGGQSGAEIYCDLLTRFPDAQVCLMLKGAALKPSDDSPFVNEIFDPERVDECYQLDAQKRAENIRRDKDTNYGVVRLELLEKIYMDLYVQQLKEKDESRWPGRVIPNRTVTNVEHKKDGSGVAVTFAKSTDLASGKFAEEEVYEAEMVFYATGYKRDAYKTILADMRGLLPAERDFEVARDYKVKFDESRFEEGRGVWLQGCCEGTHGVSSSIFLHIERHEAKRSLVVRHTPLHPRTQRWADG